MISSIIYLFKQFILWTQSALKKGPARSVGALFVRAGRTVMAQYVNIVRRALGQISGHGGVRGLLVQFFRWVWSTVCGQYNAKEKWDLNIRKLSDNAMTSLSSIA